MSAWKSCSTSSRYALPRSVGNVCGDDQRSVDGAMPSSIARRFLTPVCLSVTVRVWCRFQESNLADPMLFVELLFGGSDPSIQHISEQIFRRRDTVGHGPVLDKNTGGDTLPMAVTLSDVKEKYVCSKSRTTYTKPTNFTVEDLQASAAPPSCEITRNHIFGLRVSELYSGRGLHCLREHEGDKGQRYLVYAASSLGVVHDMTSNTQKFFDGHSDEITCISVDPTSTFVVTGQLGKSLIRHIMCIVMETVTCRVVS